MAEKSKKVINDCREDANKCIIMSKEKGKELMCNKLTGRCILNKDTKKTTKKATKKASNKIEIKDCRINKNRCIEISNDKKEDYICNNNTGRCIKNNTKKKKHKVDGEGIKKKTKTKTQNKTDTSPKGDIWNTYIFSDGDKSNKFWEYCLKGEKVLVRYGKIGSAGVTKETVYGTKEEAEKEAIKLSNTKLKKGYTLKSGIKKHISPSKDASPKKMTPVVKKNKEKDSTPKEKGNKKQVFNKSIMLADKFYDSNLDFEFKETGSNPKKMYMFNEDSGSLKNDKWVFKKVPTLYKCDPVNWLISEKHDGVRAVWDGINFISRGNKVYNAPDWFKQLMPEGRALDGELHCGKGGFQKVTGIVRHLIPNEKNWAKVTYQVFDIPENDLVKEPFSKRLEILEEVVNEVCKKWSNIKKPDFCPKECPLQFTQHIKVKNMQHAHDIYRESITSGGEGVMLRPANSIYEYKRSKLLLKWKPTLDAEAIVIGFKEGTGKFKGKLGTFYVMLINDKTKIPEKDKLFNLSGRLTEDFRGKYKFDNGKIIDMPPKDNGTYPVMNDIVTFTFMEYTDDGIPRQPIFQRLRKED